MRMRGGASWSAGVTAEQTWPPGSAPPSPSRPLPAPHEWRHAVVHVGRLPQRALLVLVGWGGGEVGTVVGGRCGQGRCARGRCWRRTPHTAVPSTTLPTHTHTHSAHLEPKGRQGAVVGASPSNAWARWGHGRGGGKRHRVATTNYVAYAVRLPPAFGPWLHETGSHAHRSAALPPAPSPAANRSGACATRLAVMKAP